MSNDDGAPVLGVLGGSGIYDIEGLVERRWETLSSPFGAPSDQIGRASCRERV